MDRVMYDVVECEMKAMRPAASEEFDCAEAARQKFPWLWWMEPPKGGPGAFVTHYFGRTALIANNYERFE